METRTFTDNDGEAWVVAVDYGGAKRVRRLLGVDLLGGRTADVITQLAGDVILLVDVVYVLCQEQAAHRRLTDEEFGRRLVGDAVDAARIALLRALIDFFPTRRRQTLTALLDEVLAAEQAMLASLEQAVAGGAVREAALAAVAEATRTLPAPGGSSSTSSPAGSSSTPRRTRARSL